MKIGIDISQLAFENTGVANYLCNLVKHLIEIDNKNEYVLFYSSMRKKFKFENLNLQSMPSNLTIKTFKFPPTLLDLMWNKLHIIPIETFIGDIDIFVTSDWTEPPTRKAKKATILYDLIVYKYPKETARKIIKTQEKKLEWVKKESSKIFCISNATKTDVAQILGIPSEKLSVTYPGL